MGDDYDRYLGAIVPPLFQNTLFTRKHEEHGYSYSRINNPTIEILEKKLAALEHAPAARVFASGMAAITATLSSLLHSGGHVLALRSAYHPVIGFLDTEMKKYGVEVTYLERFTPEEIERSLRPNTRVFYLESPSSNIFRVLPLREIAAQAHGLRRGNGDRQYLGNAVVPEAAGTGNRLQHPFRDQISRRPQRRAGRRGAGGSEERMDALRGGQRASWGACMDPFGRMGCSSAALRTLEVRMARHSASADKVARFLQEHPRVRSVWYPGLETDEGHTLAQTQMTGYSGLMSFVPDADNEAIHAMVKSLDVFEEGPSWGGFESVVNTPGLNPNREMLQFEGIPQGLVRISVGLEDADTLIEDLDRALNTLPR